jgi:hypothetical protein
MKMIFALLSLVSSSAFAAVSTVQQTLTPAASQNEINGTLGLLAGHINYDNGAEVNAAGVLLSGSYFYGLTENQAIGGGFAYNSTTTHQKYQNYSADSDAKGLNNVSFLYKGNFELGYPTLFVQGALNVAPQAESKDKTNGDTETNASSGSNSLQATVGLVFPIEIANLGVSTNYLFKAQGKYKDTDESNNSTETGKKEGGDRYEISVFGELNNAVHPNLTLTYGRTLITKSTSDDGSSISRSSGSEDILLRGSVRFTLNSHVELLPYMSLGTILDKSKHDIDDFTVFETGVTGRFLF